MRVFLTGGNGLIGSTVARLLASRGHRLTLLLRRTSDTRRLKDVPFDRVEGDVLDAGSVQKGMAGCDGCVHLAAVSAWDQMESEQTHRVAVEGTRHFLAAAKANAVERAVHVSTTMTLSGSDDPEIFDEVKRAPPPGEHLHYAAGKFKAERLALDAAANGLPLVVVNPAETYAPDDHAFVTARNLVDFAKSNPVLVSRGGTAIAHVEDVAEGIVAALERGRVGERYILAGENLTVKELAALTLELTGRKAPIVITPTALLKGMVRANRTLKIPVPFEPNVIPYATRFWFVSSQKAQRELGLRFRSPREVLAPTLEWLRASGHLR